MKSENEIWNCLQIGNWENKRQEKENEGVLGKNHGISAIFRIVKEQQTSCPVRRGLSKGMVNYINPS